MPNLPILESPMFKHHKPWWISFVSLFITLYGILVLNWDLKPIIFLFWWEVILMVGAALIRQLFALDGRPFLDLLGQKIMFTFGGILMGGCMIMFAVVFSINAFSADGDYSGMAAIPAQTNAMTIAYVAGLVVHYFLNGQYKTAHPFVEFMKTFAHLLMLLAFLMVITMHLLPAHPEWNKAHWVAVAVVAIKFLVDRLFMKFDLSKLYKKQEMV